MGNLERQKELSAIFEYEYKNNLFHAKLNNILLIMFFAIMTIGYVLSFVLPLFPENWIPNRKLIAVPAAISAGSIWLIQHVKFKGRRDNHYAKSDAANALAVKAKFELSNPPTDEEIRDLARAWNACVATLGSEMKKTTDMGF